MADLTLDVLLEIRDEIRATRTALSDRIDQTNGRLDRLERRQTESEVRLATEIVAVLGAVRELKDVLVEDRSLRATVSNHEQRLSALEARAS